MIHTPRWPERPTTASTVLAWVLGIGVALLAVLIVARRDPHPPFTSRFECGSDPHDIVHVGERVEAATLRIVIDAHCANARYAADGRIELRYGGARFAVETRKLDIAGVTYYEIVSVGGVNGP
jgi:hypothetical protein